MKFNFDSLKSRANELAKTAADKAKVAADKAKDAGRITKLTLENSAENDKIKKAYTEIGRLYFEKMSDSVDAEFVELFNAVNASKAIIAANEAEIEALKADDGVEEEPEAAADAEPELEAEAEPETDIKEVVSDVVEDVVKKVEDVIEDIKEAVSDE